MRNGFLISLLVISGLIAWTAWRFWRLLPFPAWGKWAFTALYVASFLVLFPHYMLGDWMPMGLAVATYEIGTSWMIFFLYALLIFIVLSLGRLVHLVPADSLFTVLLDHQPYHLEEAEAAGIDFQFSGHTHHGQIWPGNWVTDAMYEKAFGPHRRGATRYYVSSGLGIWGGKFRIGTRSEYIVLKLHN